MFEELRMSERLKSKIKSAFEKSRVTDRLKIKIE